MSILASDPALAEHSRFFQRLQRRYGDLFELLAPGAPVRATMQQTLEWLRDRGMETGQTLRVLRQLVMARVIAMDCQRQIDLEGVTRAMTELAELALDVACVEARSQLDALHGPALDTSGAPVPFWVIGMGKLGARELNVSSDIDLIYIYGEDGETAGNAQGRARLSHHEYFARVVKHIQTLVGDITEHGQVFRMDLALRPHGNSGPPALSLDALESYLQTVGREWERFAWLKSRVVAPLEAIRNPQVQALRGVVLPFVFRRYLDYGVFEALRGLHRQIREHAIRRSAGHPERANDVKLSRGGIRELEFTVQLLQVVRGGQFPELRCRPTLEALPRLSAAGLMPEHTAQALAVSYRFLRDVEHRIQYLDDQQTHILPTGDEDLHWIALTMGYPDCREFLLALDQHRELVAQEFDTLLGGNNDGKACSGGICNPSGTPSAASGLEGLLEQLPASLREQVQEWPSNPRFTALREHARHRLLRLVHRTHQWVEEGLVQEEAARRFLEWVEPLLRRESYLALLLERPAVHEQLLGLLGAARWPARYLLQHPGVIDELAGSNMMEERFSAADFERDLALRLTALRSTQEDDDEALLNLLRRAHHAETFRTLARDVGGRLSVEQVADDLSALADSVLRVTSQWCWERLRNRHREEPQFAIIGYGKLGGKELGYGSDLDIVFVFDDPDDNAPEVYAAFVRKLINWLTVKTGEGDLFEIDTALRPNGNSGLLVTSFDAYAKYQQQRGSNTAWTWEHQAMTRARFVLGSERLRQRFDAVRESVITAERDQQALRTEIVAMRERMRSAHPVPAGRFDFKHSAGGMIDAEFAVQYLVLAHATQHPELVGNVGNIALLRRAEQVGLLPACVGVRAGDAYRELRRLQHKARLDEASGYVESERLGLEQDAILALWQAVFQAP